MKIVLCGACGRMGETVAAAAFEKGDEVVCGVDLVKKPTPFPLFSDFSAIPEADALIDFSSPNGLSERLAFSEARGLPLVLGATGYSEEDGFAIAASSKRVPIFRSGNFSLGIGLLMRLVKEAAAVLEGFDAEIVERHHNQKKDAPSGTALMLASSVEAGSSHEMTRVYSRQGMVGARGTHEIGIHAVRGGTLVGEHEVMFAGEDEVVTLSHSAGSRKIFANGALRAAHWLLGKPCGLYGMDDLLASLVP